MRIDSLCHSTKEQTWFHTDLDASVAALQRHANLSKLDGYVLASFHNVQSAEHVLSSFRQLEHRVFPVIAPPVCEKNNLMHELESYLKRGAKAFKIHPRFAGISLSSAWAQDLARAAKFFDVPLFVCTSSYGWSSPNYQNIRDYVDSILHVDDTTKLVLLHGGGPNMLDLLDRVLPAKNVMFDFSSTLLRFSNTRVTHDVAHVIKKIPNRVSIGSDFPEGSFAVAERNLRAEMDKSNFSDLKGVLGENLWNLFDA